MTLYPAPAAPLRGFDNVSANEVSMATADLDCRRSSMVRDQYVRVYGAAARQYLDDNAALSVELRSAEAVEMATIEQLAADLGVTHDE